ncbi:hypothetical protein C942_02117 [Photobacterium marinum]|uniref:Uncharacterized protein n=1 Tax=Photobacterium marinum TaxID=1056511 RepID=L8J9X4_9GAMM|nr:hypothetical protein C942_02117 [Photobacterium marinum]
MTICWYNYFTIHLNLLASICYLFVRCAQIILEILSIRHSGCFSRIICPST